MCLFSTCDIADGMLMDGNSSGGEIPYMNQQSGSTDRTFYGRAYTVEMAPKSDPRPAIKDHYIDSVPKNSIIIIATSKSCHIPYAPFTNIKQSLYGGLMSGRAKKLGAVASVVLGMVRDIAEHRAIEYPVFSYGVGSCAANQATKVVSVNCPLDVGFGHIVNPGDHVYADINGVVIVPMGAHENILNNAKLRYMANKKTTLDIEEGKSCQESQKYWRNYYEADSISK